MSKLYSSELHTKDKIELLRKISQLFEIYFLRNIIKYGKLFKIYLYLTSPIYFIYNYVWKEWKLLNMFYGVYIHFELNVSTKIAY